MDSSGRYSHLVQLGAGRGDLLDAELAELGLELSELLCQIILALVPELDCLNLARRLIDTMSAIRPFPRIWYGSRRETDDRWWRVGSQRGTQPAGE